MIFACFEDKEQNCWTSQACKAIITLKIDDSDFVIFIRNVEDIQSFNLT